jgi:NF-kappa-B inhibitor-like protein 2
LNGLDEDLFRCQLSLASIYEKVKALEKALTTYDEAMKTAKKLKNKIKICDTLIGKGMVLMRSEKFEESRNQFKKAYKLKSPVDDDHQKAIRLLKISSIICDDFRKLSKTDSLENKISLCDKLGDHFVELKCFDIAIKYYRKQLNYATQCAKPDPEIAKIYVSIAQTYADDEQYEKAADYFNHELNCNRGNDIEECKSLIKIAEMKEYLNKEELNDDIVKAYESALEKIGNSDNNLLTDILQRYSSFIENRQLNSDKLSELREKLLSIGRQKTTECERVESEEEEEDIYDKYNLDDISEISDSESDEEINKSRPKRNRKKKVEMKRNKFGETPLQSACISGNYKQVEKLIESGHPVNVRDHIGWTPLHEAVNNGHIEIVKLLIESGANINDNEGKECEGTTPLHDACICGHFSIARLLIKKGANVMIMNDRRETALDSLRQWKRTADFNENDRQECELLERELEEALKKAGFVKQYIPIKKQKGHKSAFRSDGSSPEKSDSSQNSPINRFRDSRSNNAFNREQDFELDFDNPRVARDQYCSTISSLRRHKDPNCDLFGNRRSLKAKQNKISALLNEGEVVNEEEWLVNDCQNVKKRSCLDAFDSFATKKSKSNDYREPSKALKSKSKQNTLETNKLKNDELGNEIEVLSSDNEMICDTDSNASNDFIVNENNSLKVSEKKNQNSLRTNSKPVLLIVCFSDNEKTSFVIPILDKRSMCSWLNKEASKRYFAKFGVKPVLSLETIEGAILSDEDCILDVVTGNELRVSAKIESWVLDPLHDRYKEICQSNKIDPIDDIITQLQMTQISGCLKLTNVNIPVQQIRPIFRALERQNNLKEIVSSFQTFITFERVFKFKLLLFLGYFAFKHYF